ncbi:MAG: PDZ domain-containing protein, partial [Bacteroidaceae bacterium]|nr:PDZ domain-containing protein [Bacteroidaceae bacterium]
MEMKKVYSVIVCMLISLVVGIASAQISDAMRKLNTAVFAVREMYVDTVNETKIVEEMLNHMLHELDPHSSYTTAEETKELNEPLEGNFSGIGIQFNIDNDTLLVVQIISGGPSERVGMQAGDRIIAVNDSVIAGVGLKTADVRKFLRGPEG